MTDPVRKLAERIVGDYDQMFESVVYPSWNMLQVVESLREALAQDPADQKLVEVFRIERHEGDGVHKILSLVVGRDEAQRTLDGLGEGHSITRLDAYEICALVNDLLWRPELTVGAPSDLRTAAKALVRDWTKASGEAFENTGAPLPRWPEVEALEAALTPDPVQEPGTITVTLRVEDAHVVALGPLDYTVANMKGEVPEGGNAMRLRQALAAALKAAGKL